MSNKLYRMERQKLLQTKMEVCYMSNSSLIFPLTNTVQIARSPPYCHTLMVKNYTEARPSPNWSVTPRTLSLTSGTFWDKSEFATPLALRLVY